MIPYFFETDSESELAKRSCERFERAAAKAIRDAWNAK